MQPTMLAVALALTFGQTSNPYAGTWIAEHSGKTHIRLELHATNGALTGGLSLGDLEVNSEGEIRTVATAPLELIPIFDVVLRDSTLSFSRKEGNDTDHFEEARRAQTRRGPGRDPLHSLGRRSPGTG